MCPSNSEIVSKISLFSGKSLLLECLKERGERILHLEELANHKGSVLGSSTSVVELNGAEMI